MKHLEQRAAEFLEVCGGVLIEPKLLAAKNRAAADMHLDLLKNYHKAIPRGYKKPVKLTNFRCLLHLNKAYAVLHLRWPQQSLEACLVGPQLNPCHGIGLYKKGEANLLLGDRQESSHSFQKTLPLLISTALRKNGNLFGRKCNFRGPFSRKEDFLGRYNLTTS